MSNLTALIPRHGGREVLQILDLPIPEVSPGHAVVKIEYSALNHLDLFVREGMPGLKPVLPMIPGSDMAGTIVSLPGDNNFGFHTGDPVAVYPVRYCGHCPACATGNEHYCDHFGIFGETENGGHTRYFRAPLQNLLKIKNSELLQNTAAVGLTYLTAYQMLFERARLQNGETALILGASSGIGSAALQLARLGGAKKIIATAGSENKAKFALSQGADDVINHYTTMDWYKSVKSLTNGRGVDVVIEHTGAKTFANSMRSLAFGGRIVTCGATSGANAEFDLRHLFIKNQTIMGSTMGSRKSFLAVINLLTEGKIHPEISHILPLSEIHRAHEILENSHHFGKIVLQH